MEKRSGFWGRDVSAEEGVRKGGKIYKGMGGENELLRPLYREKYDQFLGEFLQRPKPGKKGDS